MPDLHSRIIPEGDPEQQGVIEWLKTQYLTTQLHYIYDIKPPLAIVTLSEISTYATSYSSTALFLGGTRTGPGYNLADNKHMGLIEEVCSRPGCRGIFCLKDCQFLLADRKDGKGSKYIDHGNATHSENVKDTRIQEVPHVSNIDIEGNHRPQFIALFKESRAIDKNNFSEVPKFTELLNEKDGEIAKTLQELLRNRDT